MRYPRCRYCGYALYDNGPNFGSSAARWSADWKVRSEQKYGRRLSWFRCYSREEDSRRIYPLHEPLDILVQLVWTSKGGT